MVYISGVHAADWAHLHQHWWQLVLVVFCSISALLGVGVIAFRLGKKLLAHPKSKENYSRSFQKRFSDHLQKYLSSSSKASTRKQTHVRPTSLSIYLGPFSIPISPAQIELLTRSDLIILDPQQPNVSNALLEIKGYREFPNHVVGRLDLGTSLYFHSGLAIPEGDLLSYFDRSVALVFRRFRDLKQGSHGFTGVLLARWEIFPQAVLHGLCGAISEFGLDVYLETSGPGFLKDSSILASDSVAGLVIRNGLIHTNGERRDCFEMESLETTVKAFVSQACLRDFSVFAWNTFDDDATPSNAVLQRIYSWCNFYSAIPWTGCHGALIDLSTNPILCEPLKAFAWLKNSKVMEAYDAWIIKSVAHSSEVYSIPEQLSDMFPSLEMAMMDSPCVHSKVEAKSVVHFAAHTDNVAWFVPSHIARDAINFSETGKSYDGLGCFPLGMDVSREDFEEITFSQRKLRELALLEGTSASELREISTVLTNFLIAQESSREAQHTLPIHEATSDLARMLVSSPNDGFRRVRIYLGLQSGFQRTSEKQFWAIYDDYSSQAIVDIYISKNVDDVVGTLLHTFLSFRGFTRHECLMAEFEFATWNGSLDSSHAVPPRLIQDLDLLTPEDSLFLLQQVSLSEGGKRVPLLASIKSAIIERLLDNPTWRQLQNVNSVDYLQGNLTIGELLQTRLKWHCQAKRAHPSPGLAIALFMEVQETIMAALRHKNHTDLKIIVDALGGMLRCSSTSVIGDLFALAFFCTMRKLAFEEVYLEVTDRNPLFNDQTDQAAAFAELFALGSRCEAYFGITPSRFGELLSAKYRSHYGTNQPPMFRETQQPLGSAYAEAQVDIDSSYRPSRIPAFKRFTFLSVFAIPALIDILLLTTTGHGLYLSGTNGKGYSFMTQKEQHSATVALMISLLLSGAIGTWITCGGTYYLASMAFSAMNYFIITRLLGGLALTLIVGLIGFIAFAAKTSPYDGLIFFLYLVVLTLYLSLLAALANYQFIGSTFQSGRAVIITCIPILFISPITTIFVAGHDVTIYLAILYGFVTLLLLGVVRTGARWTTWYQDISLLTDAELKTWFVSRNRAEGVADLEKMPDPAVLRLGRQALLLDVLREQRKNFLWPISKDLLVRKLAESLEATEFLMNWYSRTTGSPRPVIFTSSWNLQTKVALSSLQKSQLGIRFHNGFLHWRQAGDEIGCTILYFVVALLDKWISLIDGGDNVGLGNADVSLTMPVGFGLAYYLIGAVLLDYNAQSVHEAASNQLQAAIQSNKDIARAARVKSDNRRTVYWKILASNLVWHIWGLTITTLLLWVFDGTNRDTGIIVYLSYVLAYTGLLWYQYTKVFSGPRALKPLLIGAAAGLIVGFSLDHQFPKWVYSEIVGLGTATWTAAILSLWASRIVGLDEDTPQNSPSPNETFRAYSGPGLDQSWSQAELRSLYEQLSDLSKKERLKIEPHSEFGRQVNTVLAYFRQTNLSEVARRAFPDTETLLNLSAKLFNEKVIIAELVSIDHFSEPGRTMRAISSDGKGESVRILIACEAKRVTKAEDPLQTFYWDVAELVVQVTVEKYFNFSTEDALLARTLWLSNNGLWNTSSGPDVLERHFRIHTLEDTSNLNKHLKKQLLRDLCLGINVNIEFDQLPEGIRQNIVNRCLGIHNRLPLEEIELLNNKLNLKPGLDFETHIARRNFAAFLGAQMLNRVNSWTRGEASQDSHERNLNEKSQIVLEPPSPGLTIRFLDLLAQPSPPKYSIYDRFIRYSGAVYHYFGKVSKFLSIALVADPEYQRELDCAFPKAKNPVNLVTRVLLLILWMWAKAFQMLFLPLFLFHRRKGVLTTWKNLHGMEVSIRRRRILIRDLDGISTGFIRPLGKKTFQMLQYRGDHLSEPATIAGLMATNTYTKTMRLLHRVEIGCGKKINEYTYAYRDPNEHKQLSKSVLLTAPISRKGTAGPDKFQDISYNMHGQIDSGSYIQDENLVRFKYHYQKLGKDYGALLRAEFILPHLSCMVSWCAPPRKNPERLDTWIPHSHVTEATFVVGPDVWESRYIYDHKFHPTIITTLNGERVDTPDLVAYDHLNVLKKPKQVSFLNDNPLFEFKSISSNPITRLFWATTRRYPISTSQSRTLLWKAWRDNPKFDGVIVRWLDERLLRQDPILKRYWRSRDLCKLQAAGNYLDSHRDAIMASVDIDNGISSWTPLAMKLNDLYSFGSGGDACSNTRSQAIAEDNDETALHVIAVDTGTWPNEGGGVSACRSDVINSLRTIKWHMVAESATDFGIPKRQIERNVHSLKIVPLWGLDLLTPTHGLFRNRLDSEIDHVATHITLLEIQRTFVPILEALVRGARAIEFRTSDVKQATRALVNLNAYFKDSKNWSAVWRSNVVKSAWRNLWLSQSMDNARPSSQWFNTEHPTLGQLDQGLELWSRYLFIFSIPIPDKMPPVFQASHHSVSASYGIVCKIKRGCTLQIWDHAISWRETNLYLSSVLCPLSPFTRNSLLGLMRMTSVLTLSHADTILPCADFFNPGWEIEIGTCQGKIENRAAFSRKIDPVVNGINDMERFSLVEEIKTKKPTVTMLSHVWYAKDIKTALLAADIIINEWGFKDYTLEIYGALDKDPSYTTNCQEIIATKSLQEQVSMKGEADPIHVLKRTWVFMNSSISEGLPLALGEAALTGAPVVCTDVGASLRVLTDPATGSCYSAVVAPNDARALAGAQIKLLALLEEWSQYADPTASSSATANSSFPDSLSPEDVARITRRIYAQSDARRKLGMRAREIVQKSFSGKRYLREHEQMLWIGKAKRDMSLSADQRPSARKLSPAPAQIPNLPNLSSNQQSSTNGSSLPSLAYEGSSIRPMSLLTNRVPSGFGEFVSSKEEPVQKPLRAAIVGVPGQLRREHRRVSELEDDVF